MIRRPPRSTLFPSPTLFRSQNRYFHGVLRLARRFWGDFANLRCRRRAIGEQALRLFADRAAPTTRSEEHTSELQSRPHLACRLLLEKKNKQPTVVLVHACLT